MTILRDEDARFKGIDKKIGLFVIVALLGIVLTIASIGIRQDVFASKTRIFFITDSGQNIDEGMAVKLRGFNVGKVEKLALTDAAQVKVTLAIVGEYMKWIKADSKARLLKEGVIGANVIEITPSVVATPPLARNSQIVFEREHGLGEIVNDLYGVVVPLIKDLQGVAQRADALFAGLPATQQKLDAALASATRNFENLEKLTASELPAMTRRGRETIEGAKKVVDSVSRTWPIRGNIQAPRSEMLPADSYTESKDQKPK